MKKIMVLSIMSLLTNSVMANSCPPADQVYIQNGSRVIIQPPPGWQLNKHNGANNIDSPNIYFSIGAWGADIHTPTDADNHVRCYYYETDNDSPDKGVSIETVNVIQKDQVFPYPEWSWSQGTYALCEDKGTRCRFNG
jgi:hypothetical protein